nr:3'-5' exonuclease [uncultured Blautia sp.]
MNYIVFDLEWNQCPYGKERENKRLPFEILEIGAVKLDENKTMVDSFQEVIRPAVYKKLHFRTREILDLDRAALNHGLPFPKAVKKFLNWCGEDAKFCTWGTADLVELQRNLKYYKLLYLLKGPIFFYDIQKLFGLVYEGEKTSRSLEYAIDFLEEGKEGQFHRALNDAYYTAEIFRKLPKDFVEEHSSIDCYQNPKSRSEEIHMVYPGYYKYISREFPTKEEAMKDRGVTKTKCYLCGETARKKVRWFSVNPKSHMCLALCPKHGYFKGKIRLKKTDEGRYYVIKTLKQADEQEAALIREKKEQLRKKRRMKRHQEKQEKNCTF